MTDQKSITNLELLDRVLKKYSLPNFTDISPVEAALAPASDGEM
jgi:hypothetical protein